MTQRTSSVGRQWEVSCPAMTRQPGPVFSGCSGGAELDGKTEPRVRATAPGAEYERRPEHSQLKRAAGSAEIGAVKFMAAGYAEWTRKTNPVWVYCGLGRLARQLGLVLE